MTSDSTEDTTGGTFNGKAEGTVGDTPGGTFKGTLAGTVVCGALGAERGGFGVSLSFISPSLFLTENFVSDIHITTMTSSTSVIKPRNPKTKKSSSDYRQMLQFEN